MLETGVTAQNERGKGELRRKQLSLFSKLSRKILKTVCFTLCPLSSVKKDAELFPLLD